MLIQQETLTFERAVRAEPSEAFRAFTNPSALRDWLCNAAQVDPTRGGRVYLWWNSGFYTAGEFTNLVRNESLSFTWRGQNDPAATEVRVEIAAKDGGSTVTITHSGIGPNAAWAEPEREIKRGWEAALENLQSALETGVDLRFARRPMFGINDGDVLNPEQATKLGVPVKEGLWIGGLVEGMGAQAAGLQKDDVVVSLDGRDVTNWQSLGATLQAHQAGDRVPVVFYRGPEKRTVTVELSRRPTPELPASAAALAQVARSTHNTLDKELDECLEGVREAEAEHRPDPSQWNAKEVLAHLIAGERDTQTWIAAMIQDVDLEQQFYSNGRERLGAIVSAYPTIPVLVEELKRSETTTAAMVSALPAEAAKHKHLFNQMASGMTQFADHTREHYAEIRKLVDRSQKSEIRNQLSTDF